MVRRRRSLRPVVTVFAVLVVLAIAVQLFKLLLIAAAVGAGFGLAYAAVRWGPTAWSDYRKHRELKRQGLTL